MSMFNVKRDSLSNRPTEISKKLSPNPAVHLRSLDHFSIFQLIVLVVRPTAFLLWFTPSTLINLAFSSRQLFSVRKLCARPAKHQNSNQLVSILEHVAAEERRSFLKRDQNRAKGKVNIGLSQKC